MGAPGCEELRLVVSLVLADVHRTFLLGRAKQAFPIAAAGCSMSWYWALRQRSDL